MSFSSHSSLCCLLAQRLYYLGVYFFSVLTEGCNMFHCIINTWDLIDFINNY